MAGSDALFDTSVVNQPQSPGCSALSVIIRRTKLDSPPSHHSSVLCPPKLSTGLGSFRSPRFRRFRNVPDAASSGERWNGGLHIDAANVSPGLTTPRKI